MSEIKRIFVTKKDEFDVNSAHLLDDIRDYLEIKGVEALKVYVRYDIQGITREVYETVKQTVLAEPPVDIFHDEILPAGSDDKVFGAEYLPGQYDQRADSAAQCIQLVTRDEAPEVKTARIIVIRGNISSGELQRIKAHIINPVDSREASLEKPESLKQPHNTPEDVAVLQGFCATKPDDLPSLKKELGLAMSDEDLAHCQRYFLEDEKREPTITELRMLDTYWSDHCRHTTFLSVLDSILFEDESSPEYAAFKRYQEDRKTVYGGDDRPVSLMDIALMGMKYHRKKGLLDDLEVSDEINACSIEREILVDGKPQKWLCMFKNETHNHPTEVEPFGGAATCLGGAIRDPLSGRSWVYQAMRVTGAGDPRAPLGETMRGKLPQRKICLESAHGYSSYGNQIGLATGLVDEIYHPGYVAKRMEIGAVIGAARKENVLRGKPAPGDAIILVGGRTGRDGCGGATGSSKKHTAESIAAGGAEVQKGNPPVERKLQRLFRNPSAAKMIIKCNDFGAGGISVAIGELADGVRVDLDKVRRKYEGLDGTELAISESQERMAVVVRPEDAAQFIKLAAEENLEADIVAEVTDEKRVVFIWRGSPIVNMAREFIDTNGVLQCKSVYVPAREGQCVHDITEARIAAGADFESRLHCLLGDINVCSLKGLIEQFDSSIGAGSVYMPFGGKHNRTPCQIMAAKFPVLDGTTSSCSLMSYGFDPFLSSWSPFHGAAYAVIDSVTRLVAAGADYSMVRLTLQEYFERLDDDPRKWSRPFSALLGAYHVQRELGISAIGGKDSMSGSFEDLDVPPTLVSFAVAVEDARRLVTPELKQAGSHLLLLSPLTGRDGLPQTDSLIAIYAAARGLIDSGKVLSSYAAGSDGLAGAVCKMAFGNNLGVKINPGIDQSRLFMPAWGSILLELDEAAVSGSDFEGINVTQAGTVVADPVIEYGTVSVPLHRLVESWEKPLSAVYPTAAQARSAIEQRMDADFHAQAPRIKKQQKARPSVFIPVFPGTNCEYDTARAFEAAGARATTAVLNNLSPSMLDRSLAEFVEHIDRSQIIMIPGGFSAGDEPEGSGKFIAAVFRNPAVSEAVHRLLDERDGLVLGICNGFQALIKLGLLPHGSIRPQTEGCPTLTFNTIGHHVARMVETRVSSVKSPWLSDASVGDLHQVAISHGEGRFAARKDVLEELALNGQIATQYASENPNGSYWSIEGITSPDGRVFGKMGHSERFAPFTAKNVYGLMDQNIFTSGVQYFQ